MQDCTSCPNKDYCIPDECEQLGAKKCPHARQCVKGT
nr:MAG TPA: hypothetical protein [Caudoviricetes sp.]